MISIFSDIFVAYSHLDANTFMTGLKNGTKDLIYIYICT